MKNPVFAIALCIVVASVGAVHAQGYPTKPVRFVVGFPPGGSTDTVARIVAQKLSENWGHNVVVDNRPGAGGTIAAYLVVKAQADGYTFLVGDFGANAVAGSIYSKLPYDPAKDFAHVTQMVANPLTLVVPASSPVTGLKALIEQAKSKPGMLKYASAGIGTSPHMFAELINVMARINTVHVPYKGGAPALAGVLAVEVDYGMLSVPIAIAHVGAGRIRALGVTSANATPRLPNVPPISSVLTGYEGLNFAGLHTPVNTPKAIISKVYQDVGKVLRNPEVKQRLDALAMDISGSTPEEFAAFIGRQIKTWTAVARAANVRAD